MDSGRNQPVIPSDHLQPVLRLLRRALGFWRAGLVTALIVGAIAAAAIFFLPKQYRSEAVVFYREGMQWGTNDPASPRRTGQRLKDVLLARVQLASIIEQHGLYPELVKAGRLPDAVEEMRRATTFKLADGDVFVISFTGSSAAGAQRVTAALTDVLIGQNTRLRSQQAEVAREFLDAEKKRKAEELAAKEAEQLRFLAKHPEFAQEPATGAGVGVTLRAARPRKASDGGARKDETAIGALRREEQRLRRQLQSPGQVPSAPQDPALAAAKAEGETKLRAAQRELAERRARFTEQHPDVRMAIGAVAAAEEGYRRATEALEATQRPLPVDVLRDRLAQVEREIAAQERERPPSAEARGDAVDASEAAKRIVAIETEWARLTREVAEARERLQQLDSQEFVASMTASMLTAGQTGQILVVDPAFLPAHPLGMPLRNRVLAALAVALALGFGVALAFALLDDVIQDRFDVERLGMAPVLAGVPRAALSAPSPGKPGCGAARDRGDGQPLRGAAGDAPSPSQSDKIIMLPPAVAARGGANPSPSPEGGRAVAAPVVLAPLPSGDPSRGPDASIRPGIALRAATPTPGSLQKMPGNALFSFASDFSDLVRVHRVSPASGADGKLVMISAPQSAAAASFRVLRHRVAERRAAKTILVTSPEGGEGKTTTALNLALAMGETGMARVLLLEANFRTPAVAHRLGFQPPVCLSLQFEVHRTPTTEPWLVVESVAPWIHVAAVKPDGEGRPMLDGRALALCIEDLRGGYDYVIVDGPPVLSSADANLIEENVDGILFSLQAGSSRVGSFRKAVDLLGSKKLLGVVLYEP